MFDSAWGPDVDLAEVERLLADASDEGLTWDAKADGRSPLHPDSLRKAVCGFANSVGGGYIVVGAVRTGSGWTLPGVRLPRTEPVLVDDLDAFVTEIADRGIEPWKVETYANGVRKVIYHDPDGNEIGFGGTPSAPDG